jgi:colicin import membrane protein
MNPAIDREQPGKVASGVMAVLVHLVFFSFLFFGVNWQQRPPEPIVADLWSSLPPVPSKPQPAPKLEVKPPPPAPPKVEPPPPPKPVPKVEVKPEPKPVAKPDIALEKEKQEKVRREKEEKEKLEIKKREEAKADQKKREEREKAEVARREALERERAAKEAQIERLQKDQAKAVQEMEQRLAQQHAAAQAKEVDAFRTAIAQKVKRFVVNAPCAALGNPEVILDLKVLPDGNIIGEPTVKKSSGSAACDEAVRRASVLAQPLPMPPAGHPLLASFRNFNFNFRPMGD